MNEISRSTQVFVHREDELKLVQDRFSLLSIGKAVSEPVLFFYGAPMIGKSALLRVIRHRANQNLIPTALIDFSDGYAELLARGHLIQEIFRQWELPACIGASTLISLHNSPDDAAEKLIRYVRRLQLEARPTPLALLMDTIEIINPDTFSWLQKNLLEPILYEEKVFIGIATRAETIELPFELSWPISRRTRFVMLKPFTAEETRDHYKSLLKNASPTPWHKQLINSPNWITLGIPGLNEEAFQHPFETEQDGVCYMVEQVILKRVVRGDLDELKELALTMSSFRKFDNRILAKMANHLWPDKYPDASRRAGVQLARKIKAAMLLEMRRDGYGYVISPNFRRLLDDYQRHRKKQQHFEIHCLAYALFRDEVVRGDFVSVIDEIYHLAGAWFDVQHDKQDELIIPNDMPKEEDNRIAIFSQIINRALEHLTDKQKANMQVDKVLDAFQQEKEEFSRFLREDDIAMLIEICRRAFEQPVQIADKDKRKQRD